MTVLGLPPKARRIQKALSGIPVRSNVFRNPGLPAAVMLVLLLAVYVAIDPNLLSDFQLSTTANHISPLALAALAELCVVLTGGIDISIAAQMSLLNVTFVAVANSDGGLAAAAVTLGLGIASGTLNGLLVTYGRLSALLVTLATSFIFGAIALYVASSPLSLKSSAIAQVTSGTLGPFPVGLLWIVGPAVGLWAFLNLSVIGRCIYGIGSSRLGVLTAGLDARRPILGAYAVAGLLLAGASILLAGVTSTGDPNAGTPYLLDGIAAVALGGTVLSGGQGSVLGVVAGASVLGILEGLLYFAGVTSNWVFVVSALIILMVVGLPNIARMTRSGRWVRGG